MWRTLVTGPPPQRSRRVAHAMAAYQSVRARQRRLEMWLERRYPKLYDARHAATGIGRALAPLLGPLLTALIVLPVLALLAGLVALLGLQAPSIDLPSVNLPDIPFPDITAPGWLRAIGDAIGAVYRCSGPPPRTSCWRARSSTACTVPVRCGVSGLQQSSSVARNSCAAWRLH